MDNNNNNPIPENNNVTEQPIVQPEPVAQPEPVQSPIFDTPTPSVDIPTPTFSEPIQPTNSDIPPIPPVNQAPNEQFQPNVSPVNQAPDGQFQPNVPPMPIPPTYDNMNPQNGAPTQAIYNVQQQYYPQAEKPEANNGFSIASLIVGIISIVSSCFCGGIIIGVVAVVLGIVGLIQSNKTGANKGMAIAGIICGAVGFAISLVILILAALNGINIENGNYDDYIDDDFARGFDGFINLIKTKLF